MAAADETWKTTVFVGRLPQGVSEGELQTAFSAVGTVNSITAASVAKTSFLIEMSTEAEAQAAVDQLAGQPLNAQTERGMRVNLARAPLERKSIPNGVFVRNLPRSATEESVTAIFAGVGDIESLELIPRRGAAEILFVSADSLAAALSKNGGEMDGRTFYVEQQQKAVNPPKRTRRRKRAGGAPAAAAGGEGAAPAERAPVVNPRKLRVTGLAAGTTEGDVEAFASGAGVVQRVKLVESEVSGLHAFVTFEEAGDAEGALATLNGASLNGADVTVEADKGRVRRRRRRNRGEDTAADTAPAAPAVADPKRLWVGNVPAGLEKDVIIERFSAFGEVARFQRRNKTIRYCYVTFTTEEAAGAALGATIEIDGDLLKLEPSSASKPRAARPGRRAVPTEAEE